jgi:hypothetical protein
MTRSPRGSSTDGDQSVVFHVKRVPAKAGLSEG